MAAAAERVFLLARGEGDGVALPPIVDSIGVLAGAEPVSLSACGVFADMFDGPSSGERRYVVLASEASVACEGCSGLQVLKAGWVSESGYGFIDPADGAAGS